MPEIKRNFTQGKMNKDVDERLVPNGQYRDAMNAQVRTTDSGTGDGDVGSLQNVEGNEHVGLLFNTSLSAALNTRVIGSIADEKNDKSYFLFCAPPASVSVKTFTFPASSTIKFIDYIAEHNTTNDEVKPVVVDHWATISLVQNILNINSELYPDENFWNILPFLSIDGLRVGMRVEGYDVDGNLVIDANIIKVFPATNVTPVLVELDSLQPLAENAIPYNPADGSDAYGLYVIKVSGDKSLEFEYDSRVTGINIIQDTLCWTDGVNEPKKINIEKFIAGSNLAVIEGGDNDGDLNTSVNFSTHTTLMARDVTDPDPSSNFVPVSDFEPVYNDGLFSKEHVTVIKKYPKTPLSVKMSFAEGRGDAQVSFSINDYEDDNNDGYQFISDDLNSPINSIAPGDFRTITLPALENTLFFPNDVLLIEQSDNPNPDTPNVILTASFVSYLDSDGLETLSPTDTIKISMIFTAPNELVSTITTWDISLKQRNPLFEFKFARFSYRYKYDDGEYSAFAPFSELAFLPGPYDYSVDEAYNTGMTNRTREIILSGFIPIAGHRPTDVAEVDILYKETNTNNVYVIKNIKRGLDDEWELFTPQNLGENFAPNNSGENFIETQLDFKQGIINITAESINFVVASNQILRGFDNVPKRALAQEVSAGRIIYGNYTQGFDIPNPLSLKQVLISEPVQEDGSSPQKSVKSMRSYEWGVVFGDEFGRETPVSTSGISVGSEDNLSSVAGAMYVDKSLCNTKNSFELTTLYDSSILTGQVPPEDFDYIKYYVKETSNEYYNMVLDRWYFADSTNDIANTNRNVWLSFPSADRNKVDEETYLVLKKKHGSDEAVTDENARYKIIDISNEAPDFIKTEHRVIGDRYMEPGDDWTGTSVWPNSTSNPEQTPPSNLLTRDYMVFHVSAFGQLFGVNFNEGDYSYEGTKIKGILKARVIGVIRDSDYDNDAISATTPPASNIGKTLYSRWVTVVRYNFQGIYDQLFFFFEGKWGEDANMHSRFISAGFGDGSGNVPGLKYKMQFKEEVIVNKPEFDGRFFVKIQQDDILINQILLNDEENTYYSPAGQVSLAYVSSQQVNGGQQAGAPYTGSTSDESSTTWWYGNFTNPSPDYNSSDYTDGYGADNFTPWKDPTGYTGLEIIAQGDSDNPYNWASGNADAISGFEYENNGYDNDNNPSTYPFPPANVEQGFATAFWNTETKGFWIDYDNTFGTQNNSVFFIDGARWWSGKIGDQGYLGSRPSELDAGEIPVGITSSTTPTAGHLGRICMATTGKNIDALQPEGQEFFQWMTSENNYFRFPDDPEDNVYKIITVEIYQGDSGFQERRNYPSAPHYDMEYQDAPADYVFNNNNDSGQYAKRVGFRINFRKIDQATHTLTTDAINPDVYDPRSHMRHDGTTTINIQMITRITTGGSQSIFTTGGACWETEPKKEVELDIYYEASKAIPLRLKDNNVFNYIPINSEVEVYRQTPKGETLVNLDYDTLEDHRIEHVVIRPINNFFTNESQMCPIIRIKATNQSNENVAVSSNINIGDFIKFKHSDGTITKSKIIGNFSKTFLPIFPDAIQNYFLDLFGPDVLADDFPSWQQNIDQFPGMFMEAVWVDNPASFSNWTLQNAYEPGWPGALKLTFSNQGEAQVFQSTFIPGSFMLMAIDDTLNFPPAIITNSAPTGYSQNPLGLILANEGDVLQWFTDNGLVNSIDGIQMKLVPLGEWYAIDPDVWKYPVRLPWFNCYSFGNGVESDRIRDDFNAPQIDNGVKVSTTANRYSEENVTNGLIYSGIYNPNTDVNDLNQFIMAEKITKELNPTYGSIQALKNRYDSLIAFTEDKVLRILSNKDAIFNADGNSQLVASNKVLGNATPYVGEYGISRNPESLASDQYRMYFVDKQRGAVLRLSRDGITPISDAGMRSYFRGALRPAISNIIGTYDIVNGEYNVTIDYDGNANNLADLTVSYNESSKGWVSFKSFIPNAGVSISGKYITVINGQAPTSGGTDDQVAQMTNRMLWEHYSNSANRNTFYGSFTSTTVQVPFNESSEMVKSFRTISYEGTQGRIVANSTDTSEFYNNTSSNGWAIPSIVTDMDEGQVFEFIQKENKWYNKVTGLLLAGSLNINDNSDDFEVQGLGVPTIVSDEYN